MDTGIDNLIMAQHEASHRQHRQNRLLIVAAGEAHLLNLSIAANSQRRGHGGALLAESIRISRELGARNVYLEVRPSNGPAQALYARFGFRHIALRRGYYPAGTEREDALVFALPL